MATKIILFSIPIFFILIFIELFLDRKKKTGYYRINDSLMSLSLGIISRTKLLVIFSFAAIIYAWAADTLAITQMPADSMFTWVFSFVLYDFLYYWFHRMSHQINFLWASHVVHHQSEDYNLTTALRQTSSSVLVWLFFLPSFIAGVPAEIFFINGALNLVYQFWVHTQFVGKLGWMERIFVTPSHHRVHHGQNQVYIDKNHGGVFIIWDRLFGTFQQELDEVPVVYGVRRPVNSFNPIWANIHTWYSLLIDAIRANNWADKIKIWFMPTGWRPSDVEVTYPLVKQNTATQIKFDPQSNRWAKYYTIVQYVFCMIFGVLFIQLSNQLELLPKIIIWLIITLPLVTNGFILENKSYAKLVDGLRLIGSFGGLLSLKAELGINLSTLFVGYLAISFILLSLLVIFVKDEKHEISALT